MSYIKENFLLKNKTAEKLYFDYASKMPIFDYHCHLPEKQMLENKQFNDVFEIWLAADHYKWRQIKQGKVYCLLRYAFYRVWQSALSLVASRVKRVF